MDFASLSLTLFGLKQVISTLETEPAILKVLIIITFILQFNFA